MDQKFVDNDALLELKHSIRTHLTIMAGTSHQLCSFLLKTIDFFDDTDANRRNREILDLSFHIVEGLALTVHKIIDERVAAAKADNQLVPNGLTLASDYILVMVGKSRSLDDRRAAKYAVLSAVADALRAVSQFTKSKYSQITDLSGQPL